MNYCLLIILFVCKFESGLMESASDNTYNKERLAQLSSKLTYIYAEIQETYSLLKKMSIPGLQRDCLALLNTGSTQSGVYNVSLTGTDTTPVWCDMETDGGGWTVFQKRIDGATDFYRGWDEYRDGFGDVNHEFWLGNDKLYNLTSECDTELRVDMEDFENNSAYAQYEKFAIGNAADKYRLDISGYSGNAGNSLTLHNGNPFSTHDNDTNGCAVTYRGAWWYHSCHTANLNGLYNATIGFPGSSIIWGTWKGSSYSLKSTKMMTRMMTTT